MNISCSICSKAYTDADKVVHPTCGHLFHQECLEEWFIRYSYCAQCRQSTKKQYVRVYLNFDYDSPTIKPPIRVNKIERNTNQLKKKIEDLEKELERTKENLEEIQAVNLSLQSIPDNQSKFEIEDFQTQLIAALNNLKVCEDENESLKKYISSQITRFDKDNDDEFQKQFEQILIQNEELTDQLSKSKLKIVCLEQENGKLKFDKQLKSRSNNGLEWVSMKKFEESDDSTLSDDGAKSLQLIQKENEFKLRFDQLKKDTVYNSYKHLDKKLEKMNKILSLREDNDLSMGEGSGWSENKKNKKK